MTKLHDTLTANQLAELTQKCDDWSEPELDKLMELPLEERKLKIELGLYGRIRQAQATLCLLALAVRTLPDDMPSVLLPESVTVALWDAGISLD